MFIFHKQLHGLQRNWLRDWPRDLWRSSVDSSTAMAESEISQLGRTYRAQEVCEFKTPNMFSADLNSNLLRGVPTNGQLTLTLLRIGEVHKTPIPPVPTSRPDDADQQQAIDLGDVPLAASPAAKLSAIQESPTDKTEANAEESKAEPKHKRLSKITRIFKGNTKAVVESKLSIDHVRAKAGSDKAKGHLGVLPKPKNLVYAGPSHFKARLDGKQGWLYITEGARSVLLYTTKDPRPNSKDAGNLEPLVAIEVEGIKQLKRATAFVGKPAEMAADWSSDKELLGSVEVEDGNGKMWRFTALPERDELFNRLIALGGQKWLNL